MEWALCYLMGIFTMFTPIQFIPIYTRAQFHQFRDEWSFALSLVSFTNFLGRYCNLSFIHYPLFHPLYLPFIFFHIFLFHFFLVNRAYCTYEVNWCTMCRTCARYSFHFCSFILQELVNHVFFYSSRTSVFNQSMI